VRGNRSDGDLMRRAARAPSSRCSSGVVAEAVSRWATWAVRHLVGELYAGPPCRLRGRDTSWYVVQTAQSRGIGNLGWFPRRLPVRCIHVCGQRVLMRLRSGDGRARWAIAGWCSAVLLLLAGCSAEKAQTADRPSGGADVRAFELANSSEPISSPDIAIDVAGTIHVVWVQGSTDRADVMARHLEPGKEWSTPEKLSEGYQYSSELLTRPNGQVCAFWKATAPEAALYMRCWADGQWSTAEKAIDPRGLTASYAPAFTPAGTPAALYAVPPNLVALSGTPLTLAGVTAGYPAFAVDAAGGYHAAWLQFANQTGEPGGLVSRYSSDGGTTWADPVVLSESGDAGFDQELVADGQGNVQWISSDGAYRRWTPEDGWGEVTHVGLAGLGQTRLAVDSEGRGLISRTAEDGVYVVKQNEDWTWTDPAPVQGSAGAAAEDAVLAVDAAGRIHVVWLTSTGLFYVEAT